MLEIAIYNEWQHQQFLLSQGAALLGSAPRCADGATTIQSENPSLLSIRDADLPLEQLLITYDGLAAGLVRLTNVGRSLTMASGRRIAKDEQVELPLPLRLYAGKTVIALRDSSAVQIPEVALKTLPSTREGKEGVQELQPFSLQLIGKAPAPETIARWFDALGKLQHLAAGSAQFFTEAAAGVIATVGLDTGLVLMRQGDRWEIVASRLRSVEQSVLHYQRQLLDLVVERKCTCFHESQAVHDAGSEIVDAAVAAPIFNQDGDVIGIVYGSRSPHVQNQRRGIRHLEAQLVQLLAQTMTVGLERKRREAEAARTQILLERAFAPEVVQQLQHNPQLLVGIEREITVLFSDLRGFTEITERLGPQETYRFLGDVLNRFTEVVLGAQGVIIDYYGDGLVAMWNAPTNQPKHAELACQAAQAMLAELPAINTTWRKALGQDLALGIGLHSGPALVGNAGTTKRIKYGPRGSTINVASRVEGAVQQLGATVLMTETTRRLLPASIMTRRVCRAQLKGVAAPLNLYELPVGTVSLLQAARFGEYESALAALEAGDLGQATERLLALAKGECAEDFSLAFLRDQIRRLSELAASSPTPLDPQSAAVVVLAK